MSELPITQNDLNRSVCVASFIKEVKRIEQENKNISDTLFKPIIKGYEIEYRNNGVPVRLSVNAKSSFFKGLIVKKYVDGKKKDTYFLKKQKISTTMVNRIFD